MALDYILRITDTAGNQMISSRRKTGFIAFLAAIRSIEGIFHDWVEKEKFPTKISSDIQAQSGSSGVILWGSQIL